MWHIPCTAWQRKSRTEYRLSADKQITEIKSERQWIIYLDVAPKSISQIIHLSSWGGREKAKMIILTDIPLQAKVVVKGGYSLNNNCSILKKKIFFIPPSIYPLSKKVILDFKSVLTKLLLDMDINDTTYWVK